MNPKTSVRFLAVLCGSLSLCAPLRAQAPGSTQRISGLRDTSTALVPSVAAGGNAATIQSSAVNLTPSSAINSTGANAVDAGAGTGSSTSLGVGVGGVNPGNVNNTDVEFRQTAGGTFFPGYSPSGGIYGGAVGSAVSGDVRPPPVAADLGPRRRVTHVEALDGLTYADTVRMEQTILRFQLVDAVDVLSLPERRLLRAKVIDSPVATGSQNLLSSFLRQHELIASDQIVVGVIPRQNVILVGKRSSDEY